ncbi:MAG: DUF2493 domain-containing protein [Pseudomonadota bacterium]|nr:DUF2493 domain-containing protein [Pseudomonadota bacterium]
MRLLICGGRDFENRVWAFERLDRFHLKTPVTHVIHGAARGADTIAGEWADAHGIPCDARPADWERLGNAAGPARNTQMLREGKPDHVFALPGGKGTMNMVIQAKGAGVPVTLAKCI